MYARLYRNACRYDKHGVPMLAEPLREIEEQMLTGCPICDGRGFTWEMDMDDPDGGGYPETCPVAYQTPELHRRAM